MSCGSTTRPALGGDAVFSQNQGRRARATAEVEQAARRYVAVQSTVAAEISDLAVVGAH